MFATSVLSDTSYYYDLCNGTWPLMDSLFYFLQLLGLPDVDDDTFEEYNADVEEEEPEADHQQMGVSQQ